MSQSASQSHHEIASVDEMPRARRRINPRLLIPLGILGVGVGFAAWYFLSRPDDSMLQLSGRLEGYEADIGTKVQGRVASVTVREGDRVRKGQAIIELDEAQLQAQLRGADSRLVAAQEDARNAALEIDVLQSQVRETQLNRQQAETDAQGRVVQASGNLAAAEAQYAEAQAQATEAQAQLELRRADRDRYAQLLQAGAVSQQRYDQAATDFAATQATFTSRQAAAAAALRQVSAARGQLEQARSTGLNPEIRNAQIARLTKEIAQARAQFASAQADVNDAKAARQEVLAQLADLTIESPLDGVVVTRNVEPGEVLASGTTVLTILDYNTVYLRGYIPEKDIGRVRVGQAANVYLDSAPDTALPAIVSEVDPEASFTPENIYFRDDRVTQVFGLKLALTDPEGYAKPGMPADAEILVEDEVEQRAAGDRNPSFNPFSWLGAFTP